MAIAPVTPEIRPKAEPNETGEGAPVDDAPEWPDEAVEASMRVEQQERDGGLEQPARRESRAAAEADEPAENGPLPKLETLIEQIPADVRETLEELFRARFTTVQRVPKAVLKT